MTNKTTTNTDYFQRSFALVLEIIGESVCGGGGGKIQSFPDGDWYGVCVYLVDSCVVLLFCL
jgi:hypothetical protein